MYGSMRRYLRMYIFNMMQKYMKDMRWAFVQYAWARAYKIKGKYGCFKSLNYTDPYEMDTGMHGIFSCS